MKKGVFIALAVIFCCYRFIHFNEQLDEPHVWRQSDTANYIQDFYENGIDLGHPSVCWLGNYKTLALEFPLPEAAIAILYHIFGPSHIVARAFFFVFFILSAFYLFKVLRLLFPDSRILAEASTLIYLALPLSLFFSRSVQIDFFAVACAHMMFYYFLIGVQEKNKTWLLVAAILAAIGFLVKAPYLFYLLFPMAYFTFQRNAVKWVLIHSYFAVIPVGLFLWWQYYTYHLNDLAPDWNYLAGYRKFTDNSAWYYGNWFQRTNADSWEILKIRFRHEVLGISGLVLALPGILIAAFLKPYRLVVFWLLGGIAYLLIFFNLNLVHNYYQIPFIAIAAVLMGITIENLAKRTKYHIVFLVIPVVVFAESTAYAEKYYYQIDPLYTAIASEIAAQTDPEDLPVITFKGLDSKCPLFLYPAGRNGWMCPEFGLNALVIYKLMQEGATHFIWIDNVPLWGDAAGFMQEFPCDTAFLPDGYKLYIYDLDYAYIWDGLPESKKSELKQKLPNRVPN